MTGSAFTLEGEAADGYLDRLRKLVAAARLGQQFAGGDALEAWLSLLGPRGSQGLRRGVEIDERSGLPALSELVRVAADRELAEGFLAEHGERLPRKAAYYRAVAAVPPLLPSRLEARLVSALAGAERMRVVHELLDPASGCLVRFGFQLVQRGASHLELDRREQARASEPFSRAIERCAGADAELALLLVSELPGVTVEEVVRGQVGPLSSEVVAPPEPLAAAMAPGGAFLHLVVERAGPRVPNDVVRDPLSRLYRDALAPGARAEVDARREQLGYRVSKERRLICTPSLEDPLKQLLARLDAPLVVRSA